MSEPHDWDAALADLLEEEQAYNDANMMYSSWASSSYGDFTKIDAIGTVSIAVAAYLSGYPNVSEFVTDMDDNAMAWLLELVESLVIQGIFIGMGFYPSAEGRDMIYMSPQIIEFLNGESHTSRFEPPPEYNPSENSQEDE